MPPIPAKREPRILRAGRPPRKDSRPEGPPHRSCSWLAPLRQCSRDCAELPAPRGGRSRNRASGKSVKHEASEVLPKERVKVKLEVRFRGMQKPLVTSFRSHQRLQVTL